ncbi:RagB/SusD family nutrient uptake outer membrane protein [Mucilaginibacter arboris]|uniref:RagB/SusD family nutrient uptake outer membrane protein n=1 Tax=Mucilaginibacter arboris TaxID=2682090 RepID=A0A7K1ST82_9SPHI|nr:RagB/SusD family nutrient uptake outer membrane protein [Mucilaginibacter arboris]MVN20464.1 RagB/SusD family nutrient uptake outer membrane protein [Mucilaginibacter arboris]
MKRILFILVTILSISMVSCKKFLDTVPTDSLVQSQYYNTEAKLNQALAGVYQPLNTEGIYGNNLFDQLGASTDEGFYARSAVTTGVVAYNFDYGNNDINNFWTQLYVGIERANILIQNINIAPMDETKRQVILGEALFLRGYYYFLLVSNFGDVPLKTTPTASVTDVNLPRTAAKQVYAQILADMTAAEGKVSSITALGGGGHVSTTAVEGILARVCLTMAGAPLNDASKYADALAWAKKVQAAGVHSLNPSYRQIFINLTQDIYDIKESMWEVESKGTGADGMGNANRLGNTNGIQYTANNNLPGYSYGFVSATAKLFNLYPSGDLRRDWSIAPYSYNAATTPVSYNYFTAAQIYNRNAGKFRREYELSPLLSKNITPINFPILRYADVLLMLAEAENQINGPTATAYDAINQVRRRGFGLNPKTPVVSVSVVSSLTLSTSGNTGYLTSVPNIPISFTGGGGTGATGMATVSTSTGKVTSIAITNPGSGYTSVPTAIIGTPWAANTVYNTGTQVVNGNNVYTVTTAGTSTATGPTQTSGPSSAAATGAVFTYAGVKATATVTIATTAVDLAGLSQASFFQAIQDERARELCYEALRKPDLIRWGIWVTTMNNLAADIKANAGATFAYAALAGSNISGRNVLFPIPASELSVNKLATQNPGW